MNLSPEPLLAAFERFNGSLTDLDLGVSVDAATFQRTRSRLAQSLATAGVRPGDRLILAVGNGARFLCAFGAALTVGAAPILLHFQTPPAEMRRVAERYRTRFMLCDQWTTADWLSAAVLVHEIETESWARWLLAATSAAASISGDDPFPQLVGVPLHPTSGTSGEPKIAVRPASAAIAEALHYIQTIGIDDRDTVLAAVPMSHAYGFGMCAMVPLLCGARVVSMRSFNPRLVQRACLYEGVTIYPSVPAMLDILSKDGNPEVFPRPIRVFTAGSAVSESVAALFEDHYGAAVRPLYGTTETGGIAVARSAARGHEVAMVGPPLNDVSVELRSIEREAGIREGLGYLRVRSESMMSGYLRPGGIDESMVHNGWFDTGDLASIDATSSVLRLHGRDSDVINIFGMKVLPLEVEEVIKSIPAVREVIVYRGTHRSGSQLVKAAIVSAGPLDSAEVREHCERNLAPYKRPQLITFVDALPRTSAGKIIRAELP